MRDLFVYLMAAFFPWLSLYLAVKLARAKDDLDVERVKHRVTLMYLERARAARK